MRKPWALVVAIGILGSALPAAAAEPSRDAWDPSKARVRPLEIAAVPLLGAGMLVTGLAAQGATEPKWVGRNGLDDAVRDGLRGRSEDVRQPARVISDALFIGLSVYPVLVDAFLLSGALNRHWDVALRILVSYGQAGLGAGLLTVASQGLVFRGRPLVDECGRSEDYDPMCGTKQLSRSFFAGHSAAAFSGAATVCQDIVDWPLYGSRAGGIAACVSTMTLATTTSVLRIVGDKHWASDVVIGSGIGLGAGLLTPWIARRLNRGAATGGWRVVPITGAMNGAAIGANF